MIREEKFNRYCCRLHSIHIGISFAICHQSDCVVWISPCAIALHRVRNTNVTKFAAWKFKIMKLMKRWTFDTRVVLLVVFPPIYATRRDNIEHWKTESKQPRMIEKPKTESTGEDNIFEHSKKNSRIFCFLFAFRSVRQFHKFVWRRRSIRLVYEVFVACVKSEKVIEIENKNYYEIFPMQNLTSEKSKEKIKAKEFQGKSWKIYGIIQLKLKLKYLENREQREVKQTEKNHQNTLLVLSEGKISKEKNEKLFFKENFLTFHNSVAAAVVVSFAVERLQSWIFSFDRSIVFSLTNRTNINLKEDIHAWINSHSPIILSPKAT